MNVLVIEDSETDAEAISEKLKLLCYPVSVDWVISIEQANAIRKEKDYDVVLADLMLPDSACGENTLQQVRNGAAVIAITAQELTECRCESYLRAGADFVLPKDDAFGASAFLWQSMFAYAKKLKAERTRYKARVGQLLAELEAQ